VAKPNQTSVVVSASQLSQASYQAGSGPDTLWVQAYDGTQWSPWAALTFIGINPAVIGTGQSLEVASAFSGPTTFTGTSGTLQLDNSASFTGTVAGMAGQDTIDFTDIDPTKVQAPIYSGDASGGTLMVTDGAHTANIALIGNYLASTFVASSDGHGGTNVIDPPAALTQPTLTAVPHA
jgi:hypothetical protein